MIVSDIGPRNVILPTGIFPVKIVGLYTGKSTSNEDFLCWEMKILTKSHNSGCGVLLRKFTVMRKINTTHYTHDALLSLLNDIDVFGEDTGDTPMEGFNHLVQNKDSIVGLRRYAIVVRDPVKGSYKILWKRLDGTTCKAPPDWAPDGLKSLYSAKEARARAVWVALRANGVDTRAEEEKDRRKAIMVDILDDLDKINID